jgi:Fe2+ transport system protein FeoA
MVYEVVDVPESEPCDNCILCLRLKLMEMGFVPGQNIEIGKKQFGLLIVYMITKSGQIEQTIALRQDEMDRVCLKETI